MSHPEHGAYRPDIDGLRAVAVVAVVLFHAGLPVVPGGFVGVDVFFVISGFLITNLIARDINGQRFSIAHFYERRARRILPALFAMMAMTAIVASFVLIPYIYERFALSALAAALSVSNVFFFQSAGYFDIGSGYLPLLHTWSLGVEEQFYLLFPVVMFLWARFVRRPFWMLVLALGVFSFALSVVQVRVVPEGAFYLPFSRTWELALGGWLAVGNPRPLRSPKMANLVAVLGLGAIVVSCVRLTESTRFPGELALFPCVGAAMVIHANSARSTAVGRLLSSRPFVFVGLISYSFYLWHWPILVFGRAITGRSAAAIESILLVGLILAVSVLSWRYVEQPFRSGRRFSRKAIFRFSAAGIAVFVAFGGAGFVGNGFPQRFPLAGQLLAQGAFDRNPDRDGCDSPSLERIRSGDLCILGAEGVPPTVAVVGDSFGDALMPGIKAAALDASASVWVMTYAGCRPLVGLVNDPARCQEHMDVVTAKLRATPAIDTVLLVGRWTTMVEGTRFGAAPAPPTVLVDTKTTQAGPVENQRVFRRLIERTVQSFGDKRVLLVAYLPEQEVLVPQAAAVRALYRRPPLKGVSRSAYDRRQRRVSEVLADRSLGGLFTVLDAGGVFCNLSMCPAIMPDGHSMYFDDNHVSRTAAVWGRSLFEPAFRGQ